MMIYIFNVDIVIVLFKPARCHFGFKSTSILILKFSIKRMFLDKTRKFVKQFFFILVESASPPYDLTS